MPALEMSRRKFIDRLKQPAISRFEKRGEVKLSTLAATIKALGGKFCGIWLVAFLQVLKVSAITFTRSA